MFKLGRCFDRKREYSESVVYFGKALKIDPKSATVAFKLGWA
jgi:tetratricopeptide (TPR) repeat protein